MSPPTDEPHPPPWLDVAAALPIAFAQVREDALIDLAVLSAVDGTAVETAVEPAHPSEAVNPPGPRVLMIASGGCTAAALAASSRVGLLHLVDANPAQIALSRLKLHLLETATPADRRRVLGHAPMPARKRADRLAAALVHLGLPADALGPPDAIATIGPDHAGRYEVLFFELREAIDARLRASGAEGTDAALECAAVLHLRDPAEQARRAAPDAPLGRAFDAAFDEVMALPTLIRLFGQAATQNGCEPFARHFAHRTRHALATLPAADNPYLWQMLAGRFPPGVAYPWLDAPAPPRWPDVRFSVGTMDEALKTVAAGAAVGVGHIDGGRDGAERAGYDLVHLSNILDWLTPEQGRRTLALAHAALRPGGRVIIRQLNSTLDVPALGGQFEWLTDEAARLHARDRSFFYRSLHLGRRPGRRP